VWEFVRALCLFISPNSRRSPRPPLQLRVEGLPTPEQAEVARDLLAVWGWLALGGRLPEAPPPQQQQQHEQQQQQQGQEAAGAAAGTGTAPPPGLERQGSTAGDAAPPGPPPPPLNHPLAFYVRWAPHLRQLAGALPLMHICAHARARAPPPPPRPAHPHSRLKRSRSCRPGPGQSLICRFVAAAAGCASLQCGAIPPTHAPPPLLFGLQAGRWSRMCK
jgi:hypothetical protein